MEAALVPSRHPASRTAVRCLLVLLIAGVLVATGGLVLPARPAAAQGKRDLTAAHRITAEFYGMVYDDFDFGPDGFINFDPPVIDPTLPKEPSPDRSDGRLRRIVDFNTLGGSIRRYFTPGDGSGLVHRWGRGPFRRSNGQYDLRTHRDAALCFERQRVEMVLQPDNAITLRARVGLIIGKPYCGGALAATPVASGVVSVTAPPHGRRVCGDRLHVRGGGDEAAARLCLVNERFDPVPLASTASGNSGVAPFTLHLDGSPSTVPGGLLGGRWDWDFGDGHTATSGPEVTHYYPQPGTYVVTLAVTSAYQITRSAPVMTVVVHPPSTDPVARLSGGGIHPPGPVTLSAAGSTDGDGRTGVIYEYWWDLGDGTEVITRTPEVTHTYASRGGYVASVTVYTADLRTSTATTVVTIE